MEGEDIRGCRGKQRWPELVGKSGTAAASVIERENPKVHAIVLPEGSATTRDLRCDRVWVFVDRFGHVVRPPVVT